MVSLDGYGEPLGGLSQSPSLGLLTPVLPRRDASYPILSYLSRPSQENKLEFSPACSIFARSQQDGDTVNVLELGSGQSMGTLHLLDQLSEASSQASPRKQPDKVFLSDLPDVIPLCQASIGRWKSRKGKEREVDIVQVEAVPLAWGDMDMGSRLAEQLQASGRRLTHILLLDLVSLDEVDRTIGRSRRLSRHAGLLSSPLPFTYANAPASDHASLWPTCQ
jgi:hypothetical protein